MFLYLSFFFFFLICIFFFLYLFFFLLLTPFLFHFLFIYFFNFFTLFSFFFFVSLLFLYLPLSFFLFSYFSRQFKGVIFPEKSENFFLCQPSRESRNFMYPCLEMCEVSTRMEKVENFQFGKIENFSSKIC